MSWVCRVVCVVLTVAPAALAGPSRLDAHPPAPVLIVGDSIATGMLWHPSAVQVMQQNLAVDWQVAVCRTITGVSCPFEGNRPPTLVDLVSSLGHVPPIVVVELGYNDPEETFASSIDAAMSSLLSAGARHVLWLTLRETRDPYPALNLQLEQAASRWPQLELVDWGRATENEPSWFQGDGVHLDEQGGIRMARMIHGAVAAIVDPLRITAAPVDLRPGRSYKLRLRAAGGTPPYKWAVAGGRPPRGFHLLASGKLEADLPRQVRGVLEVAVHDGASASAAIRIRVG
jgi:hypothetical protein